MAQSTLELLTLARSFVGLREVPGVGNERKILEMFEKVGHPEIKSDSVAWCAAFVGYCLKETGYPIPPVSVNLLANSYLTYGVACDPQPGCIGVWPRGKEDWMGHVGIVETVNSNGTVTLISGNDGNMVRRRDYSISDARAFRMPIRPDVKDLRVAGSKEIKMGDRLEKGGIIGTISSIGTAVGDTLTQSWETVTITAIPTTLTLSEQILQGAKNVWDLVAGHPWIAGTMVVSFIAILAGRAIKKHRVERAQVGVPLSAEVIEDAAA